MKYIVTDPNSTGIWTYEQMEDGSWTVVEPENAPTMEHALESTAPTLIEAVLRQHRRKGRAVEVVEEKE